MNRWLNKRRLPEIGVALLVFWYLLLHGIGSRLRSPHPLADPMSQGFLTILIAFGTVGCLAIAFDIWERQSRPQTRP